MTPQRDFKVSYVALDRTSTPDSLIMGEYRTASSGKQTRLVKWDLNAENRKLKSKSAIVLASLECKEQSLLMRRCISVSNENNQGDLYTWTACSKSKKEANFFPPSPDLSYKQTR